MKKLYDLTEGLLDSTDSNFSGFAIKVHHLPGFQPVLHAGISCILMALLCTLNGRQGAVAHEGRTQCTAKATRSQTEQGTPGDENQTDEIV